VAKRFAGPPPGLRVLRPGIPTVVDEAVQRALEPVPADRVATAAELAHALKGGSNAVPRSRGGSRRVLMLVVVVGALGLMGALAAYGIWWRGGGHGSGAVTTPGTASVAVLPFVNLSAAVENEYFSDGITDELTTALSRVTGLRVASRTSAFAFKGKRADVDEIGGKLHVTHVLEGSVRREGNRLRVTVQLIDVGTGYQAWADRYDRELKDVFAVQDELARAIVSKLEVTLTGREAASLARRPTADLVAYDLYLKGRYAWNQRTPVGILHAAPFFEEAIVRDTQYAQAYAGLADAYILLPDCASVDPAEAWVKARAAAERALALDSTLAAPHAALAYGIMRHEWDWRAVKEEFTRAIALDPSYATGRQWYADFLGGRGRLEESVAEMRRAQALDPVSIRPLLQPTSGSG
jgi:TolB-like protein